MRQIIKKTTCVLLLFFCSFSAIYAANSRNITLIIQGTGQKAFVDGFKEALTIEAKAAGYEITENQNEAKYSIKFTVEFDQSQQRSKFVVSLVKLSDSTEIISMEYLFADEEEMLLYSQLVFFMLVANLPDNEVVVSEPVNNNWRNKWLYISPYYNYSLMFLELKGDGLIGGIGIYHTVDGTDSTDNGNVDRIAPLDNKIIPMILGAGLGIEFQFLDFMSIELGGQISLEEVVLKHKMLNILGSAKLKFPLKFLRNVVFSPYGVVGVPIFRIPTGLEVFDNYSSQETKIGGFDSYSFGGGIQIAVKSGNDGALFFDVSYMLCGDSGIKNQFGELYPNPTTIHYKHSNLSFCVGYKFGLFNRKSKSDR